MFKNYPKKRISLPKEYKDIYAQQYKKNREGKTTASSLSQKAESWMHRKVAQDVKGIDNKSTLEIGAGTLNQLKYEKTRPYDIVEPFIDLYQDSKHKSLLNDTYTDISEISEEKKYDRITSIATFEHITDLPKVVAKTCILLNPEGNLRISIPNEGSFLWKIGWMFTTGFEFKIKYGLDYGVIMKHEHVNTAKEIEEVLQYFYSIIKCYCFGINKKMALYRFYECSSPNIDNAKEYLKTLQTAAFQNHVSAL